jgi:hypothetical protein
MPVNARASEIRRATPNHAARPDAGPIQQGGRLSMRHGVHGRAISFRFAVHVMLSGFPLTANAASSARCGKIPGSKIAEK